MAQPICDAVHTGLRASPKSIPCRFFYDHRGSELFEQITELPEYYLTRCEAEILNGHACDIVEAVGSEFTMIEFGSGSSAKTRTLIGASLECRQSLHYVPIDISRDFLRDTAHGLLDQFPGLSMTAVACEYGDAMDWLPQENCPKLFLFLGSNIGNFDGQEASAFLRRIRGGMAPQDRLLLGVDLVKDRELLFAAYNDSAGVTAEFNKNLLRRINAELNADFDADAFDHHAPFDEAQSRIEMRLISRKNQVVRIEDLESEYEFQQGEPVRTEWSHKYTPEVFKTLAASADLDVDSSWTDSNGWFAEYLLKPLQP